MKKIQIEQVSYVYQTKYQKIEALKNINCSFDEGKMYAIVGASGSGKSTLLSLIAGLDLPSKGSIKVENIYMEQMDRDRYRREQVAVVYQSFHLFPLLNALENVMFPLEIRGIKKNRAKEKAKELLQIVGLGEKIWSQFPQMMSGGEQQRVAIARAMTHEGNIILADEPTGNLDSQNERVIVSLLKSLAQEHNYLVIVVTHNESVAQAADIVLTMKDGEIIGSREND